MCTVKCGSLFFCIMIDKWPIILCLYVVLCHSKLFAQQDSTETEAVARMVNLTEVVVRSDLNVPKFIERIKNDTTFYKAFRNLRVLGFTSLNDVRMIDKKGKFKATLQSKTRQNISGGCRTMDILEEKTAGNIYDSEREFNYYTAQLYASLFFTKGRICGENNIVKGIELSTKSKTGIDKHKEQLKMMFFNPGKKIPGIPFIGNKINIFDPDIAQYYNFDIDMEDYEGQYCYIFSIKIKDDLSGSEKDNIVFDNMTTWFNSKSMEIVARNYDLSYNTPVYDFNVHMEVQMTRFNELLVPKTIRYNGTWDVVFKKRERGVFTATLFDFTR
ncbi:MAG: hypothetical protein M3O67_07545 [Bacteroidota bacterium]|nr:hypothetical protein [Bacteroidota bacterium]